MGFAWKQWLSDDQMTLLAGYREHTGRAVEYAASAFLEWLDGAPATIARTTEFLWGYLPLRFRSEPEPPSDYPQQVADLVEFAGPRLGWDVAGCMAVCADTAAYERRWRTRNTTPLPLWLEELRLWMTARELECSVPPADPDDPLLAQALRDLKPGTAGLLAQVREPDPRMRPPLPEPCTGLEAVGALLEVIGAGVRLTDTGRLGMAHGRAFLETMGWDYLLDEKIGKEIFKTRSTSEIEAIELTRAWAGAARLVRVRQGKLVPTTEGRQFGRAPMDDWWALFDAGARRLSWATFRYPSRRRPFWAELVADHGPAYLRMALDAGRSGIALLPVAALTWSRIAAAWVTDQLNRDQVRWQVDMVSSSIRRGVFLPLELLGAAETWIGGADGAARLTPIGLWAVARLRRQLLEEAGKEAQKAAATRREPTPKGVVGGGNVIDLAARRPARRSGYWGTAAP
ncbi:MAG TPA: hypothetical protein VFW71_00480 [Actinomycetota bacterium]|nr:hypothetical protein [Actinomycetota bacterium]